MGSNKWIPVTVTRISGAVSYQVQTSSGSTQRHYVDQLRYCHSLGSNGQELNNFDDYNDWPVLCTTSITEATSSLEQAHGQLEVTSSTTTFLQCSN